MAGLAAIADVLVSERERWPLWLPVAAGMGILGYFAISFEPALWNEKGASLPKTIDEERVSQVWFAGVHSNIGGGYPDGIVDLDRSPEENLSALAEAKGVAVKDITACILDLPLR